MVNESAKTPVDKLRTPGKIMGKLPTRDRKRAFYETQSSHSPGSHTLTAYLRYRGFLSRKCAQLETQESLLPQNVYCDSGANNQPWSKTV